VTGWGGWFTGQRGCWLWSRLSASVGRRCSCTFASPACLRILCGAILARKESDHFVLMKHSRVSFYHSLQHLMPRQLNTPLLLFSDLDAMFLDKILRFLYSCARKPSFHHFGRIQGQVHVTLFQQYPTSLPCHSSRHVENLREIRCCF